MHAHTLTHKITHAQMHPNIFIFRVIPNLLEDLFWFEEGRGGGGLFKGRESLQLIEWGVGRLGGKWEVVKRGGEASFQSCFNQENRLKSYS